MENKDRNSGRIFGLQRNVFFLGLTSFWNDLSSEMVLSVMPAFFIGVLKTGAASLGFVEGVADAASNLIKIYSGRLSDKIDRRKPFAVAGYSLAVATRPFYTLVSSVAGVVGLRFADRIGKGLRESPRDALIALSVPKEELGKSFGYHRAMDTAGAIIGPLVAYLILRSMPGRFSAVFMVAFALGVVAVISLVLVKEVSGAAPSKRKLSLGGWGALPGRFKAYLASVFVLSIGSLPLGVLLFRASDIGFTLASIPLFYMLYSVSYALFSIPAGKLADKRSPRNVILLGYAFLIAGYGVLGMSDAAMTLVVGFLLVGLFSALTDGVQKSYASRFVPAEAQGSAFGYLNAAIGFGALAAGVGGGFIWDRYGDGTALMIGAAVVALGLVMLALGGDEARKEPA